MSYSVGQVAALTGVTVRALHHYDEIRLLSPSGRSSAGYRRYSDDDLERLQQVLLYRELRFPLEEIATILADPAADAGAHLRRQHRLLTERIARLQGIVAAIEYEMEVRQVGISLTPEERFELFGDFPSEDYAAEAEQRWGETEAYRQSQRRVSAYQKEDWQRIAAESAEIKRRLVAALQSGAPAGGPTAMDAAEEHRQHIARWFYDCSQQMHRGLGDLYVGDERFRDRYDAIAPGLAQYARDAIHANADRAEAAAG